MKSPDNHSLDQIYPSFNTDSPADTSNPSLHICSKDKGGNSGNVSDPRPPTRVMSPAYLGKSEIHKSASSESQVNHQHTNTGSHKNGLKFSRDSRSVSPLLTSKGNYSHQSASRVKSLDHLTHDKGLNSFHKSNNCDMINMNGESEGDEITEKVPYNVDETALKCEVPLNCDKTRKREKIEDNFLTDEEIQIESLSADLY